MGDTLLNGREAGDFEDPIERGHRCDRERDAEVVAGLLAEYPREPSPVLRPVTELAPLP